ncbi:MBL fold metallo-hydrolase [Paracoccus aminophilus]|uniref:Beta-lactamase domain-containing protein n=1 Tax=Paracoccus aminophilus JCM 7686 TaxID=1367847 RepID=S5XXU8_PARAH|nr:MBL fold metallo-hydrolase [Paracoccus aminophilus]AGT08275.1 beta-lactamase domain-containing protein [Paracoccus aminophilus JCM 7686]
MRDLANALPELFLLQIGHCRAPEILSRRKGRLRPVDFPAGAALILHPRHGAILFDTGYGRAFFEATAGFPERLYRWMTPATLPEAARLPQQLARFGIDTPDLVILSHLHADHVAGYFDLTTAPTVLTSREAFEALDRGGRLATLKAGCPEPLRQRLKALRPSFIENCAPPDLIPEGFADFAGLRDIFGDGSVLAVPLPGHGIGQFGLFLPETSTGPQFLIADAAWSLRALRENAPPPNMSVMSLGNKGNYLKTFLNLRMLSCVRSDIRLLPSHCAETFSPTLC